MSSPTDNVSSENVSKIHIKNLSKKTQKILSEKLNNKKFIQSENSLSRDWRGIIELCKLRNGFYDIVEGAPDHMDLLLKIWCKNEKVCPEATLENLLFFLEQIDRYDVAKDVLESIDNEELVEQSSYSPKTEKAVLDKENIELDLYDAYVLYEDQDEDFVWTLIEKLPNSRLCLKDDITPGLIKHAAATEIIKTQCRKVIVVISKHFLENPDSKFNKFLVDFAQATQIDNGSVRIIPIVLEEGLERHERMPENLKYLSKIQIYKNSKLHNVWERLDKAVMGSNYSSVSSTSTEMSEMVERTIQEMQRDPFMNGQGPPPPPEDPPLSVEKPTKKSKKKKRFFLQKIFNYNQK